MDWAEAELEFLDEQIDWAVAVTCDDPDCNPYLYPKALAKTIDGGKPGRSLNLTEQSPFQ